jgi:hypothetical protein
MVKRGIQEYRKNQTYGLIIEISLKDNQCGLLDQRVGQRELEEAIAPSSKVCKYSSFVLINIHIFLAYFFQVCVCST